MALIWNFAEDMYGHEFNKKKTNIPLLGRW